MEKHQTDSPIHKYDIWLADLPVLSESHVQSGIRPVIVASNDVANTYSPIITVIPLTTNLARVDIPTHTVLHSRFLRFPSMALCEQLMVIDKTRLLNRMGALECVHERLAVRHCVQVQLGLVA